MKKYRTTIIALAAVVLAVIAYVVISSIINKQSSADPGKTDDVTDEGVKICAFSPNNVTKLTVYNDELYEIVRVSGDTWTSTTHPDLEIYDTSVYDILTTLGTLSGNLVMDGDKENINYSNFGLDREDDPKYIRVLLNDGKSYMLYMGIDNLSGSKTYVRLDGVDKVFSISALYAASFKTTKASFIYLYPFKFNDTNKINVLKMVKNGEVSLYATSKYTEKVDEKSWQLTQPIKRNGNTSNLNALISSLVQIKLEQVEESNCQDLSKYGLDVPDTTYTLQDISNTVKTVSIGKTTQDEKYYYCTFNNGNDVYTVDKSFFKYKDTNLLQFIDTYAFLESYTVLSHVDIMISDDRGTDNFTMDIETKEEVMTDANGNILYENGEPKMTEKECLYFNGILLKSPDTDDEDVPDPEALFKKVTTSIYRLEIVAIELDKGEVGDTIVRVKYTRTDGSTVTVEGKARDESTMYLFVDGEYIGGYCRTSRVTDEAAEYSIRHTTDAIMAVISG